MGVGFGLVLRVRVRTPRGITHTRAHTHTKARAHRHTHTHTRTRARARTHTHTKPSVRYTACSIPLPRLAQEVVLVKPFTSRPANSEKYIICKGKRTDASFATPDKASAAVDGAGRLCAGDPCENLHHINNK